MSITTIIINFLKEQTSEEILLGLDTRVSTIRLKLLLLLSITIEKIKFLVLKHECLGPSLLENCRYQDVVACKQTILRAWLSLIAVMLGSW
jgi:hypothetical protein